MSTRRSGGKGDILPMHSESESKYSFLPPARQAEASSSLKFSAKTIPSVHHRPTFGPSQAPYAHQLLCASRVRPATTQPLSPSAH